MLEISTDTAVREAMQRAHKERAQAMRAAWRWLFPSPRRLIATVFQDLKRAG